MVTLKKDTDRPKWDYAETEKVWSADLDQSGPEDLPTQLRGELIQYLEDLGNLEGKDLTDPEWEAVKERLGEDIEWTTKSLAEMVAYRNAARRDMMEESGLSDACEMGSTRP